MSESYIHRTPYATAYVGPDATALLAAMSLRAAIGLYVKTGLIPTRGFGIHAMLNRAQSITGKTYRRGEAKRAMADLTLWIDAMKLAMPVLEDH